MATIQEDDDDEGSVMLTIVPNEDGEMVAVPVRVGADRDDNDDDGSKSMTHVDSGDNGDSHVSIVEFNCGRLPFFFFYISFIFTCSIFVGRYRARIASD